MAYLPWLPPAVPSLLALARPHDSQTWQAVREDPGAVLLLLRCPSVRSLPPSALSLPSLLESAEALELAVARLRERDEESLLDWDRPGPALVRERCLEYARQAERLAVRSGRCDPDLAWAAGLLAPLGWLARAAADPLEVADCLHDPAFARDPAAVRERRWRLENTALARRLCRLWRLPGWLCGMVGRLGAGADVAARLGADPDLFQVTQLAVSLVQRRGGGLELAVGASVGELLRSLDLPPDAAAGRNSADGEEFRQGEAGKGGVTPPLPHRPSASAHLLDVLTLAAENRRLREERDAARLEDELDVLHRAVEEQRGGEEERLRARKLAALAEFAAGAGHEINNPLAVISGQAQYLLLHEAEPSRRKSLETIIGQTHRIHHLLRDVMQFARPPAPRAQSVDLTRLVEEVAVSLAEFAEGRQVRLRALSEPAANGHPAAARACRPPVMVEADPSQLRTALTCLVRNAIEAAPADGWARVRIVSAAQGHVEVLVEDSGDNLAAEQREHLFDPFYSGRPAGRGAGLGLPTAWSLARQQGGDVFLASQPGEPTRFVLRLPSQPVTDDRPRVC